MKEGEKEHSHNWLFSGSFFYFKEKERIKG